MTITAREAVALLRTADPVRDRGTALDARAEADLLRILTSCGDDHNHGPTGRTQPRIPRAQLLAAAAVAVALASAAAVALGMRPATDAAYAATPERLVVLAPVADADLPADGSARAVLEAVAARVAELPDDTGDGRYARMATEGWALWTSVDGDRVTSGVVPQRTTVWVARDGSGRVLARRDGPGGDSETTDDRLSPGERSFVWPLGSLPADDAELAHALEESHPVAENGPAERLAAVTDLVREQPLAPPVRAAVLRYLARTPGLEVDGIVADRAGRRGVAVHVDTTMSGLPERRTLIVDPDDGRILGEETLLTETAGRLNAPVPSVIGYTTFRSARYTDDLT